MADARPFDRTDSGVHPWVGVVCLAVAMAGLMTYLTAWHGLAFGAGCRTMISLAVLGLLPGLALQRLVFRLPALGPFEEGISALLLGMLVTPAVWYALACLGLGVAFAPMIAVAALIVPFLLGWHHEPIAGLRRLGRSTDPVALVLVLGLMILWSYSLRLVEPVEGGVAIWPYTDHIQHALMVRELSLGVPTQVVPFLAGAKKWAYHMLPDVWCDLLRRGAGTDSNQAYFFLALPLRYVLVSLAVYLFLARRFGRRSAWIGVVCVFGFTGWGERQVLTNWLLGYLHQSYPTAFGLVGVFLILTYATDLRVARPGPQLLLCSLLSVLLLWYKANFALVAAPAAFLLSTVVLLRSRSFGWWAACLGVQAAFALIRLLDVSSSDLHGTFVFEPGAFVVHWWGTLGVWWGTTIVSTFVNGTLIPFVSSLPAPLEWPMKFVLLLLWRFHVAVIVLPYAVWRFGFARGRQPGRHADRLVLGILACTVAGFVVFPIQRGMTWNVSLHNVFLLDAMLMAMLGVVAWDAARRVALRGRIARLAVITVALLVAADSGRRTITGVMPSLAGRCVISNDLHACCDFVAENTPEDAVIVHPDYAERDHGASLLMQRRQVLDNGACWQQQHMKYVGDTLGDLDALFGRRQAEDRVEVLTRYGVDYVVAADAKLEIKELRPVLQEVFRAGDTAVYRVDRRVRLARAR